MPLTRRTLLQGALAGACATPVLAGLSAPAAHAATATTEVPDAAFFGAWDAASGAWATPPVFDYPNQPGLSAVADAARSADYPAARAALLAYMRTRPDRTPPAWAYNGVYSPSLVPLLLDHIWTLGKGEIYQTTLTVEPAWTTSATDVTGIVKAAVSAAGVGFMLMARNKESATAEFGSRHATTGAPVLALTHADGSVTRLGASQSSFIAAGADAATAFGSAPSLFVHDEGTGPFAPTTRKAYLWFDLTGVTAPRSATLELTGRTDAASQDVMLHQVQVTFDETTRCWNNTVQNTFSWQADPHGFDWKKIAGADVDSEFFYQLPRFYFAGPLADAYRASQDEHTAAGLIGLITDFIDDTNTAAYGSPNGAASYPRNLDAAWRYQNWCYAYEILRTSPSLTADANTSLLKAMYAAGPYFSTTTSPTPNWMITIKSVLLYLGAYFPEFAQASRWRADAQSYLVQQVADALYPDGGYTEASSSYAMGVATTFVGTADVLVANGYPVGSADPVRKLAWFLADETYPNGYDPAYGDSSYGNQRPALAQLAALFDDDRLRYVATGGTSGTDPGHTSVTYPDTRVAVQRTGWTDQDWYLRLAADRGNHGHADELAVQVYAHDRPLLPAMGAYVYAVDPTADWLRATTQANNTVTIDGKAQDPTAGGAVSNVSVPWADLADGHTDATPGVRHARSVLFLHGLGWLVTDTLTPADSGPHAYQQNWHLLPDAAPALDGAVARTNFASGTQLAIVPAAPKAVTATLADGYYSPVTYQVSPAKYVSYALTAAGPVTLDTLLLPVPPDSGTTAELRAEDVAGGGRLLRLTAATPEGALNGFCLRAPDDGRTRRFGPYSFDGSLAYVDHLGDVQRILLTGGSSLQQGGRVVAAADAPVNALLAVRLDPIAGTVDVTGPAARPGGGPLRLAAPWARTATVAGETVPITHEPGLITLPALH
ncbi:heparinase II/III family protein [Streptomyces sp. NPDC020917]|uniref:heparinase II/III family protein n=1 Tax=Streptomyces sp. NPDC020917 TaxID=3365102 RepID=UPI0037A2C28A